MTDEPEIDDPKPSSVTVLHPARGLIVDDNEDAFAAAMIQMAQPLPDQDEADAEYAAAEALKIGGTRPLIFAPGDDDMPVPMDYEGED